MTAILILAAYGACCVLAYRLFLAWWLQDFDATRSDVWTFRFAAIFGPLSVFIATMLRLENSPRADDVLYRRKPERKP